MAYVKLAGVWISRQYGIADITGGVILVKILFLPSEASFVLLVGWSIDGNDTENLRLVRHIA